MTTTFTPDAAAKKKVDPFDPMAQFDSVTFHAALPDVWRSFAGTAVDETREAYERTKATLEAGLEAVERSYDAASQATAALNRKIIDIAQRNIDSGFDLAKSLASAKNFAEILELQGSYWRKQFETLMLQAEEVRDLSAQATNEVAEPMARQAARQAEQVQELSKQVTAEAANAIKRQVTKLEAELRKAS